MYATFPPTHLAMGGDSEGLLCFSQQQHLDADTLMRAYRQAIFPWSSENKHNLIAWFSPKLRPIFLLNNWQPSRSMRKVIKHYERQNALFSVNQHFSQVLEGCANRENTWITPTLKQVLLELHQQGNAWSFEVNAVDKKASHQDTLLGGIYGIVNYPVFFAESMFSRQSGASKFAFFGMMRYLKEMGYTLVDAQIPSPHLRLLGSSLMDREKLQNHLQNH